MTRITPRTTRSVALLVLGLGALAALAALYSADTRAAHAQISNPPLQVGHVRLVINGQVQHFNNVSRIEVTADAQESRSTTVTDLPGGGTRIDIDNGNGTSVTIIHDPNGGTNGGSRTTVGTSNGNGTTTVTTTTTDGNTGATTTSTTTIPD